MEFEFSPVNNDEHKLFFSTGDLSGNGNAIGYLRADFGSGNDFYSTWFDMKAELKTNAFKEELDKLVNYLRSDSEKPLLRSRKDMLDYCSRENAQHIHNGFDDISNGFKIKTKSYSYYLRCKPCKNYYDLYCFCYDNRYLPVGADSGANRIK